MMDRATTICPRCAAVQRENEELRAQVAGLKEELAKAQKTSTNSSKPPSSDIVKPRGGKRGKKRRKRGAQPGHPRHQRPLFSPEQIDHRFDHTLDVCPDCGGHVTPSSEPPRIVQQVEVVAKPIEIREHRGLAYWCEDCQKTHHAPLPGEVRQAGLMGPRLTALVAYLKGACHASFSTIRKFLRDVLGIAISRGHLRNVCAKVADSLASAYEELLGLLPREPRLNVDETGHKDNGQAMWTWCFRASLYTLFKIDASRGSDVLMEVLGKEFNGVLGCDYFSAYRKYMRKCGVLLQFCLAHLIRDVKFLVEHPHAKNRTYGRRVLEKLRQLFHVIHRRDRLSAATFAAQLEDAGNEVWAEAVYRVPNTSEAQNLAKRFEKHGESYLRFITTPGIEPTNNLAEQAIRFVVLDRHVTQGSRSVGGQRWLERIWTAIATCTQQGRSVFTFLYESVLAYFRGEPTPSLVLADTS
jgi:transposase